MKFTVTLKDPDCLHDAVKEAARDSLKDIPISADEKTLLLDGRTDNLREIACKWFNCGEYLTVEIDTEANTCIVLEDK